MQENRKMMFWKKEKQKEYPTHYISDNYEIVRYKNDSKSNVCILEILFEYSNGNKSSSTFAKHHTRNDWVDIYNYKTVSCEVDDFLCEVHFRAENEKIISKLCKK